MCAVRGDENFSKKELRWAGLGVEFCVVVCLFAFCGYWLDRWVGNQNPEFLITGFFVGFFVMFYHIFKSTKDLRK